jgi:hypothetical protein
MARHPYKKCFRCGELKVFHQFYEHPRMADGRLGKCKECTKIDVRNCYRSSKVERAKYERARYQRPERRAYVQGMLKLHNVRHPDRYKARSMVKRAVRNGRLIKSPCAYCGALEVQAHHDDYSRPLDIKWVCFACHRRHEHGQIPTSDLLI